MVTNAEIASVLDRIADLLQAQDANPFRIRAYRQGANILRALDTPVADFVEQNNLDALEAQPGIGEGLARLIAEYVDTGRSTLLERLEGDVTPVKVFQQVPGIGEELAQRIVDELHIETLEELEEAAHDGRLEAVPGFGQRRSEAVQHALEGMLSRTARRRTRERNRDQQEPSVAFLLDVDAEYRKRAEAGKLPTIAPKRFNPGHEAWLPILHTDREGWSFTALYSNTARAHELGKTDDWVVIYFEREGKERQRTVVTETDGALVGKRVIRGREVETQRHYLGKSA